jgi:hypothetical protein
VAAVQGFTDERPYPVCGGYDRVPRGQGLQNFGFRSTKGPYVFRTQEELPGRLVFNTTVLAYRHTIEGGRGCGGSYQDANRCATALRDHPRTLPV